MARRASATDTQRLIEFVMTGPIIGVQQLLGTLGTILEIRMQQAETASPLATSFTPTPAATGPTPINGQSAAPHRLRSARSRARRPMTAASTMPAGEAIPLGQPAAPSAGKRGRGRPRSQRDPITGETIPANAPPITARPVDALPPSQPLPDDSGPLGEQD